MSTRPVGPSHRRLGWCSRAGALALALLLAGCATHGPQLRSPRATPRQADARSVITLSPDTDFEPVQVSEAEFRHALAQFLLEMPMPVARRPSLPPGPRLVLASSQPMYLAGPGDVERGYWRHCEGRSTPGDCLSLLEDGDRLDAEDRLKLAVSLGIRPALEGAAGVDQGTLISGGHSSMRYFKLTQDVSIPGCWYLANPTDQQGREVDNPWQFRNGSRVNIEGRLRVPVYQAGRSVDFSITGSNVPIVTAKLASVFAELAPRDVQLIPVDIEAQSEPFSILVCTRVVKCIDDARSGEARYWKPEDGRPERTGQYRSVLNMRIDPTKVGDAKVFRTWGWMVALIISEDIKEALEQTGATGLDFQEV